VTLVDHVRFGISHSSWALEQLIAHAEALPPGKAEEDLGIGPGSLRVNIAHTIEAMLYFADCFAGRDYTEPPDFAAKSQSFAGLLELLARASAALSASMISSAERGLTDRVLWPGATDKSLVAATAVAQVFDHATVHRTQAINMLKRLGVKPLPKLDPMSFQATGLRW
jgi:uncharacterized damage-inducible protein DinB